MKAIQDEILKVYGDKLRVRVCGIYVEKEKVLLVKHHSLGKKGILWAPPGGGIEFGESAEDSLKREFKEETGLEVEIKQFLFINEYLAPPLHAIELFFEVSKTGGILRTGSDPEMASDKQIIHEVRFFSFEEIRKKEPEIFHAALSRISDLNSLITLRGYYKS